MNKKATKQEKALIEKIYGIRNSRITSNFEAVKAIRKYVDSQMPSQQPSIEETIQFGIATIKDNNLLYKSGPYTSLDDAMKYKLSSDGDLIVEIVRLGDPVRLMMRHQGQWIKYNHIEFENMLD